MGAHDRASSDTTAANVAGKRLVQNLMRQRVDDLRRAAGEQAADVLRAALDRGGIAPVLLVEPCLVAVDRIAKLLDAVRLAGRNQNDRRRPLPPRAATRSDDTLQLRGQLPRTRRPALLTTQMSAISRRPPFIA